MKTRYSITEAQENFDEIIEEIEKNGTTFYIYDDDGREFVMIPYSMYEEIEKEKEKLNKNIEHG